MKLCILLPFFGPYNSWFPYYLSTCAYLGPEIEVLIFTENEPPPEAASLSNVRFLSLTLEAFRQRVASVTGLSPAFDRHNIYKICDYKPLYGKIFEREIEGYDFWAYGDEDIFFGNLLKFIHRRHLEQADVICAVREMKAFGPLTFVRNTERLRELFLRECRSLRAAIEDERCWGYDEGTKLEPDTFDAILRRHPEIQVVSLPLVDDDLYYAGNYEASDARCYHENEYADWSRMRYNWALCWDRGRLLDLGNEIPFFHFIKSKDRKLNPGFRESFEGRGGLVEAFHCSHRGLLERSHYERALRRPPPATLRSPDSPRFDLSRPGDCDFIDYEEFGRFFDCDSQYYRYQLDAPQALAEALGEGILGGASWVRNNPLYQRFESLAPADRQHWARIGTAHPELDFFCWAEAPEPPAVKLYYTADALRRAGHLVHALKAYQAITVLFPNHYAWDPNARCSWYLGPAALEAIQAICAAHPRLGVRFEGAKVQIHNPSLRHNDPHSITNDLDIVIVNPGRFRRSGQAPPAVRAQPQPRLSSTSRLHSARARAQNFRPSRR